MKRTKEVNLTGRKVVSIDIGKHTTKIIAGQKNEGSIELTHALSFPTPGDSYENGRITDLTQLADSIGDKLKAFKIKASRALCSFESSEIITRESVLPYGTDEEVEKMLDYEIQHMPIEPDNYMILSKVLDYKVYELGVPKVHTLVTAVPKEIVYNYYDLLRSMKLKPVVFDTQSNALDKLIGSDFIINEDASLKNISFMVLDIGHGHINISIFEKGKYVFSRSLKMGAETIDLNLMQYLEVSQEHAEAYKLAIRDLARHPRQADDEQGSQEDGSVESKVLNIVRNTIDRWLENIERVMHYYTTQSISNNIRQIYIYGGTTKINGFDRYVQQAYNIPVSRIKRITNVLCDFYEGDDELASYINALGTMIRR